MTTMTANTTNLAADYARSLASTLDSIWQAADGELLTPCQDCNGTGTMEDSSDCSDCDGAGEVATDQYGGQPALDYLDEMPLEVVWEKGEPFAVLLTFGGPNAWIFGGGRMDPGYHLDVYWDTHAVERSDGIRRTGE